MTVSSFPGWYRCFWVRFFSVSPGRTFSPVCSEPPWLIDFFTFTVPSSPAECFFNCANVAHPRPPCGYPSQTRSRRIWSGLRHGRPRRTRCLGRAWSECCPDPQLDAKTFYSVPMGGMLICSTLIFFACRMRRNPAGHKRLILIATIAIMDAAIDRWPLAFVHHNRSPSGA
jgi:hypothetical protein